MRRYNKHKSTGYGVYVLLFVVIVIVFCLANISSLVTSEYNNLVVTDKSYSGSEDGFIVWMEDLDGTQYEFSNNDVWLRGKFDSTTVQGNLKVGSTYRIKTCGWRIPLFSCYENIIEYELIESED